MTLISRLSPQPAPIVADYANLVRSSSYIAGKKSLVAVPSWICHRRSKRADACRKDAQAGTFADRGLLHRSLRAGEGKEKGSAHHRRLALAAQSLKRCQRLSDRPTSQNATIPAPTKTNINTPPASIPWLTACSTQHCQPLHWWPLLCWPLLCWPLTAVHRKQPDPPRLDPP